jgi:hypothetical protein
LYRYGAGKSLDLPGPGTGGNHYLGSAVVFPLTDGTGNPATGAIDSNDAVANHGGSSAASILQQSFYQPFRVESAIPGSPKGTDSRT